MARYIKDYQLNIAPQSVYSALDKYLKSEGYEYIAYDGENVYKKGQGFWCGPTFFKFTFSGNYLRLETWMKYALLPGVYIDELSTTGFAGSAVKGPWKKRIAAVEEMLSRCGIEISAANQAARSTPAAAQAPVTPASGAAYGYNQSAPANAAFTQGQYSVPGAQQPAYPPAGQQVSRKEFIEKYAQPSLRSNIKTIAIVCYVCAAITFIYSVAMNPYGIIDAAVLLGLSLGMHLAKSRICAFAILALSIIEMIVGFFAGSYPFWWLIAGISAVITFNKIEKQYKEFKKG